MSKPISKDISELMEQRLQKRFRRMLGYDEAALIDRVVDDFIRSEDRWGGMERGRKTPYEEIPGRIAEKRFIHRNGREIPTQVTTSPIGDDPEGGSDLVSVVEDITERRAAKENLVRLNAELEERVESRTRELRRSREEIRRLVHLAATAEERERRRIAEGLHDDVQQLLAACSLSLESTAARIDDPEARKRIETVCAWTHQALEATRSLIFDLSPAVLYELGLGAAVQHLAELMRERLDLEVELSRDGEIDPLPEALRVFLYGTVRELLFNVHYHSDINHARLFLTRKDDRIDILVTDSGRGFDPEELDRMALSDGQRTQIGLSNLRERLSQFDGRLELESAPGRGTNVRITAPVKPGCEIG